MAALIALITLLSVPAPLLSNTRRLISLALGAMPRNVLKNADPVEAVALPATMPATCVPWPYWSAVLVMPGIKLWL